MADDVETKFATKRSFAEWREQSEEMLAINEKLIIAAVQQQELAEAARESADAARESAGSALKRGEFYRLLAENFPNGMVLLFDRDVRHILAGGRGLIALGLSKEVLEGRTIWEGLAPQTCRQIEPAYRAALSGEATVLEVPFLKVPFPKVLFSVGKTQQEQERANQDRTHQNHTHQDYVYQFHTLPILDDRGEHYLRHGSGSGCYGAAPG